jgi:hypothetical protein
MVAHPIGLHKFQAFNNLKAGFMLNFSLNIKSKNKIGFCCHCNMGRDAVMLSPMLWNNIFYCVTICRSAVIKQLHEKGLL